MWFLRERQKSDVNCQNLFIVVTIFVAITRSRVSHRIPLFNAAGIEFYPPGKH